MAYSAMSYRSTGYIVLASDWTNIVDNFAATSVGLASAKGQLFPASGTTALSALTAGANYSMPIYLSSATSGLSTAPTLGIVKLAERQEVVSSSTETDLISYSVPASAIGANGSVTTFIRYSYKNNSGSSSNYTLKCYLGGTAINVINARAVATGVTIVGGYAEMTFTNQNATNAQYCIGSVWDSIASGSSLQSSSLAIDTTAAVTVKWTITMSVNNASTNFRQQMAWIGIQKAATIA